jgi:hypothetical protein
VRAKSNIRRNLIDIRILANSDNVFGPGSQDWALKSHFWDLALVSSQRQF